MLSTLFRRIFEDSSIRIGDVLRQLEAEDSSGVLVKAITAIPESVLSTYIDIRDTPAVTNYVELNISETGNTLETVDSIVAYCFKLHQVQILQEASEDYGI